MRVEILRSGGRRRHWSPEEKTRVVAKTLGAHRIERCPLMHLGRMIQLARVIFSHARMESSATPRVKRNVRLFMNCLIIVRGIQQARDAAITRLSPRGFFRAGARPSRLSGICWPSEILQEPHRWPRIVEMTRLAILFEQGAVN